MLISLGGGTLGGFPPSPLLGWGHPRRVPPVPSSWVGAPSEGSPRPLFLGGGTLGGFPPSPPSASISREAARAKRSTADRARTSVLRSAPSAKETTMSVLVLGATGF